MKLHILDIMKDKILLLLAMLLMASSHCMAQKIVKTEGSGKFVVHENDRITLVQAKEECEIAAKIDALQKAFGQQVKQEDYIMDTETDGIASSSMRFEMMASTIGDWIRDTKPAKFTARFEGSNLVLEAEVYGEVREVIQAKPSFTYKVLAGGTTDSYENNKFRNKERIYITFRAPASGYVAVYAWHGDDQVSTFIPFGTDYYKVESGRRYTFFDRNSGSDLPAYVMSTDSKLETNQIIIVYSPNKFTKCPDYGEGARTVRHTSYAEFKSWLENSMRADTKMTVARQWITIINDNAK